jgi:NitT/TauT family transport system permease protein
MDNAPLPALNRALPLRGAPAQLSEQTASILRILSGSPAILALIALWELAPRFGLVEPAFLPPFSEVVQTTWRLALDGQLGEHVGASLSRSLAGFGGAILIAVPLGMVIGNSRRVYDFLNPVLEVFRNTAALALLPVFILLLGIGEASKIAIVFYVCSWSVLLNTITGVRSVDPLLIKSARTMGVEGATLMWKVTLPAALPTIFTGIRLAGSSSLLVLVAAEMVGAKAGLGYLIQYSQYNFQIPQMYAGILTSTAIGLLFAKSLLALERRFTSWQPQASR